MPSVDELLADLVSQDESAAEAAVPMLAEYGDSAVPSLLRLLEAPDAEHRWWVVRTLAAMRDPKTEWLLGALRDAEAEVRAAAALALAAHPDAEAAAPLVHALNDDDSVVAVLAVNALTKIGADAVAPLLEAFAEATRGGRIQITRALAELRDPRAIPLMMKSLDQESAALQYWAREGLERLGLNMVYLVPD